MWPFKNKKYPFRLNCDYKADALGTRGKSLKWREDPRFKDAWKTAEDGARLGWTDGAVPDVRWRVHVALWAASVGLRLEGDFVECGVHTGILTSAICDYHDWKAQSRNFWLFDTWGGIPTDGSLTPSEREMAVAHNANMYHVDPNLFDNVRYAFARHRADNIHFVRGILPGTLKMIEKVDKIAYLSIDLNYAAVEKACIEALWDRLVPGAIVLIDDYGWAAHRDQTDMWDAFAAAKDRMIMTLPTGQGVLVK